MSFAHGLRLEFRFPNGLLLCIELLCCNSGLSCTERSEISVQVSVL